jgi:5-methylcytosine-specific restriction endonuclease McrA
MICELPECDNEFEPSRNGLKRFCSRAHTKLAGTRRFHEENPGWYGARYRRLISSNPSHNSDRYKRRRDNDPDYREKNTEKARKYRESDYGYAIDRACGNRHSAIHRGAPIDPEFKDSILANILLNTLACQNCGRRLDLKERLIDHKLCIALGGEHTESNVQILCTPCHVDKTAADMVLRGLISSKEIYS